MQELNENMSPADKTVGDNQLEEGVNNKFAMGASPYSSNCQKKVDDVGELGGGQKKNQMPPASVMTRLILIMVWRKLIRNPNTYSSLFGLVWSLVSFK